MQGGSPSNPWEKAMTEILRLTCNNAEEFVENMYSGGKESLRPIYNELLALGRSLGTDVKVCPCKTMVPLYRKHVFAQIKPTTRTRIDLGLALKDTKVPKRLIDTGGFAKKGPHHTPDRDHVTERHRC